MILQIVLLMLLFIFVVSLLSYQGEEFKKRAEEIIQLYNDTEKYMIKNTVWTEPIHYESEFCSFDFSSSKDIEENITYMITEAIKCFKSQNIIARIKNETLFDELSFIQRKLVYLYTFS